MKILILTSEYPSNNDSYSTPVVHFFSKEWLKNGNEIYVICFVSVFPTIFYIINRFFSEFVKKIFKTDNIPKSRLRNSFEYEIEGVNVKCQPIFKIFPHCRYFDATIKKQAKKVFDDNLNKNFNPDIIIAHFLNPQLPLITELKEYYPNIKTSLVMHENPKVIRSLFRSGSKQFLSNLDYLGFRFEEMRNVFFSLFGKEYNTFICPSGIPEKFILSETPKEKFIADKISICFVGMLIPLKNVDILLEAVDLAFPDRNFTLEIVGEGMLKKKLSQKITKLKLEGCVKMLGKLSRDEVQEKMFKSDIFTMVSKPEAFGLVYVEAMSKGCITIGTKGQGIDGVIQNGENGFLCEAGNVEALKDLFIEINRMPYDDKVNLANNAIKTASLLTDTNVASEYFKKITSNNKSIMHLEDVKIIELPKIEDQRGNLSFLESNNHIPFKIKRTYWIYDVPGGYARGGHAFLEQHEFIIALSGGFDVVVDDGKQKKTFTLNRSYYGLYIPSTLWREMNNFSTNSLAMVSSSTLFSDEDYIRDYDLFLKTKQL